MQYFPRLKKKLPNITYVSFFEDLGFLIFGHSISIIGKIIKKASKITHQWKLRTWLLII